MPKLTNVCFTWNVKLKDDGREPTVDEIKAKLTLDNAAITYWCYQVEKVTRLHVQGFLQCRSTGVGDIKKWFPDNTVHIEAAKSIDLTKARDYCKKSDSRVDGGGPFESGEFRNGPARGKRSDLDQVAKLVVEGVPIATIAVEHAATYVRNYRGLAALGELANPPPKRQNKAPNVWVYSGVTGSGKSRRARDLCGERVYVKGGDDWWCSYSPRDHDYVLFEEFEGAEWMPPTLLLQLVDRYTMDVRKKGIGSYPLSCGNWVFTCNKSVKEWYKGTKYADEWYQWDFDANKEKANCKYMAFMRRLEEGEGGIFNYDKHWDDQDDEEREVGWFNKP